MERHAIKKLTRQPGAIRIEWGDGHTSTFPFIWLKDNAPGNRHPSGQKLGDISQIPTNISPASITLDHFLHIEWTQDGQSDAFDPAWLRDNACEPEEVQQRRRRPTLWDAQIIQNSSTEFDFAMIAANHTALRDMLRSVREYGFAIIHGVPAETEGLFKVVDLFGYVRVTNYGRLFDVRVTPNPTNLAFTGLTLVGHTDNPYRHPVPTLQLLHFLKNSAEGGDSTLADGFKVAEDLQQSQPQAFNLLANTPVSFRYRSEDADLRHESTIIERDVWGRVNGIRFNNRSMQPFYCPPEQMDAFYDAYRTFGNMLEDPEYKITFKLDSGDLMIFDNQRILHGRIGYQAGGERHLQGCYADLDSLLSRLSVLEREFPNG